MLSNYQIYYYGLEFKKFKSVESLSPLTLNKASLTTTTEVVRPGFYVLANELYNF